MSRARLLGLLLGIGLVAGLTALLAVLQPGAERPSAPTFIRQIDLGAPPPPPPPAAARQPQPPLATIELFENLSSPVALVVREAVAEPFSIEALEKPEVALEPPALAHDLSVNWAAFGLDQLDTLPRLITDLKVRFPKHLTDRGVVRAAVELSVMIDESGAVHLKRVVRNPHPELDAEIQRMIRRARFTMPTKDGVPVRAAFVWPLLFEHS